MPLTSESTCRRTWVTSVEAPGSTVHSTRVLVVATALVASIDTAYWPARVGVPETTPVSGWIKRPGGRPWAEKRTAVALVNGTARRAAAPTELAGLSSVDNTGAPSPVIWIIFDTEGTPWSFIAKSM